MKIVVVESGWVLVGHEERGAECTTLTGASTVRRWGTTQGLGQLAQYGPTKDTVLDPCGVAYINNDRILFTLQCNEEAWSKKA
jgi:hypothetical protein